MSITNAQYDSIMHEYHQRRILAEREAALHESEIYEKIPLFRELDNKIASYAVSQTKKLLSGESVSADKYDSYIDELSSQKTQLLINAGYPCDYLEPKYTCVDCKDTGYIDNQKCHCFQNAITEMIQKSSRVSQIPATDTFENISFEYYDGENLQHFKNTVEQSRSFVQNFKDDYQNLLFYGTVGTGKSFLSGCIANELSKKGYSVFYYSSTQLFKILSDIMFDKGDAASLGILRDDIYGCDLLIIDDLGTELTNSAVATQIFSLINERHLNRKSTIISTNLDLEQLNNRYDDRVFSRILEWYNIRKIEGPDIRRLKKFK